MTIRNFKNPPSKLFTVPLIVVVLLITPSSVFADTFEVYTYGGGDFLYYILNGVAMIFSGSLIKSLIKVVAILLLLIGISRLLASSLSAYNTSWNIYSGEGFLDIVKVVLIVTIALQILSIPKADVLIVDRSKPSQTNVVSNVPYIQAFVMHATSTIGDVVGEAMEDVMSLPDSVKFRNHGVALGAKYTGEFMNIYPPDTQYENYAGDYRPYFIYTALREYFMTCLFEELVFPNQDDQTAEAFNAIFTSPDILNDPDIQAVAGTPNKLITGIKKGEPTMTCSSAPGEIKNAWNEVYQDWVKDIVKKISGTIGAEIGEGFDEVTYTESIIQHYMPDILSSKDTIINIAAVNTLQDAMIIFTARTSSGASLAEYLSKKKTTAGWISAARLLNAVVIILRQIFEGLIYGMGIFLPIFFVIAGFRAVGTYVKLTLWLHTWIPFYVILNLLADIKYGSSMEHLTALAIGEHGVNFRNITSIQEQANIVIGLVGATAWSVPAFAWGIMRGGGYALSHALGVFSSAGGAQRIAQQVGGEIQGTGNVSVANKSIGNESIRSSDAVTSRGSQTSGWVNTASILETVNRVGLPNYSHALASLNVMNAGKGTAIGSAAWNVGNIDGQRIAAAQQTFGAIADRIGVSPRKLQHAFSELDFGTKEQYLTRIGQSLGIQDTTEASQVASELMGDKNFVDSMTFKGIKDVHSVEDMIKAGAGKGVIGMSQTLSALSYMAKTGMTPKDFGGAKGMVETAGQIGDIQGFKNAYKMAQDNGFKGNEAEFAGMYKEMGYSRNFSDASKLKDFAQRYFGGNEVGMFKSMAALQYGKTMGTLQKIQEKGWTPDTLAEHMGHMDAASNIARVGGYGLLGDSKFMQTETGKMLNEAAKFEMLKTVAQKAGFAGEDRNLGGAEMYEFLKAHQGNVGVVLNDEQAKMMGHEKGGKFNMSLDKDGNVHMSQAERGKMDNTVDLTTEKLGRVVENVDVNRNILESNPLKTDSATVFNKIKDMDSNFAKTLLSGTQSEQDTKARTASKLMATNFFLKRHGVDTDQFSGDLGISADGGIKEIIGKVLPLVPNARLSLRESNAYREEINKIEKDFYNEIKGHQEMVGEGVWSPDMASEQLSLNLSKMTHEYEHKESLSDNTRRGKDKTYLVDNR